MKGLYRVPSQYNRAYSPKEIEAEVKAQAAISECTTPLSVKQPDANLGLASFALLPNRSDWSLIGTQLSVTSTVLGQIIDIFDLYFLSKIGGRVLRVDAKPEGEGTISLDEADTYIRLVRSGHYKMAAGYRFEGQVE